MFNGTNCHHHLFSGLWKTIRVRYSPQSETLIEAIESSFDPFESRSHRSFADTPEMPLFGIVDAFHSYFWEIQTIQQFLLRYTFERGPYTISYLGFACACIVSV